MRLKDDVEKLRLILLEHSEGLSWGELREKLGWSLSVQKDRIDLMENRGELATRIGKRKQRRTTIYMLADLKKSEAESAKYIAMKFIENLRNPVYGYGPSKDGKATVSAFISPVARNRREWAQKKVDGIAEGVAAKALRLVGKGLSSKQKIAVILTLEG